MHDFQTFDKIPRLFRDTVITEKIDGTNGQILITHEQDYCGETVDRNKLMWAMTGKQAYYILAGSRTHWLGLEDDFGFAEWVGNNANKIVESLGVGRHYGEWFGQGIQRNYGLPDRHFALFNTKRWGHHPFSPTNFLGVPDLTVVPTLHKGPFDLKGAKMKLGELQATGSHAAQGFLPPEGIIVYHEAARQMFKYTGENDGHNES